MNIGDLVEWRHDLQDSVGQGRVVHITNDWVVILRESMLGVGSDYLCPYMPFHRHALRVVDKVTLVDQEKET